MANVRIVLKGKGDDFVKDPKKVLEEFGLYAEKEMSALTVKGAEPKAKSGLAHVHTIVGEAEIG